MSFEEVQKVPGDAWPGLRLGLVPSFRALELAWKVADVWLALDEERPICAIESEPTFVAVWRMGFVVRHRCCTPPEARAVARLAALEPFSAICESMADSSCVGLEDAAERAFRALQQWLADGWLSAPARSSVDRHPA